MANLPEPVPRTSIVPASSLVRHPNVVRAAVSPISVAVVAAGAAIGILLVHSIIVAVILGGGAWVARMLAAILAQSRRDRAALPKPAALDPYSVPEPWRQLLHQAGEAQTRFDQTIRDWPSGPTRDRLSGLQPRLWAEMVEIGTVAHRGAALSGWTGAGLSNGRPSAEELSLQLRRAETERRTQGQHSPARDATLARTEEAIAAQLRAVRAAEEGAALVHDRLRVVVARLDETITSLLVLGVAGADAGTDTLVTALNDLNDEITSLQQGLTEASDSSAAGLSAPSVAEPLPLAPPVQPPAPPVTP
jgi:hypothetical protein